MAAICLISPGHLATNPRLVKEADALHEAGHSVHVVCGDFLPWAREADSVFSARRWASVTKVPFGPKAPALLRVVQVARQRMARPLFDAGVRVPSVVGAAWHQVTPDLARAAAAIRADLYVAHYVAALPAAARAARLHGARYAFDAEDFHLGDPPEDRAYDGLREHTRAIESRYLPGAVYVTAASPGIADAYVEAYGIPRPTVLLNVFPRHQAPGGPTERGSAVPGPSIYWFSQTIGPDRGLECAARAIGIARSRPHLYLRGSLAPGFEGRLVEVATAAGAATQLHFLDPACPSELERLAANHDMGFVGETEVTPNRRIALANKVFSYILAGIPAVASDIPAHRWLAERAGQAMRLYPVESPKGLADAMDAILGDGGRLLAAARAHAFALGRETFNWDVEKETLLRKVEEALSCPPAGAH